MFRFRECREAAGLSQKYAAISVGVRPPSMSDWESGRTSPTCDKLVKLAELYGVTVDDLLGVEDAVTQSSAEERRLISILHRLNAEGRARLLEYAEDLSALVKYKEESAVI